MPHPRISVLLPVLNGERYLHEAITSIVTQDYRDFELIVLDDGSTDGTWQVAEEWARRDSRIVLLRNERNIGISASLNKCLAASRGEYIARQDGDDISEPGRLSAEVDVLDARPDVVLVSMNYHVADHNGKILQTTRRDYPPELLEYLLHFSNVIGGHTQVMYRRDAIVAAGAYNEALRASLDYELWTRMIRLGRFVVLPQAGMRYRIHEERITVRENSLQVRESWNITRRMLTNYLGRELTDDEARAVAATWRRHVPASRPDLANAVAREAYEMFARQHPDETLQRLACEITSMRFAETAATLLRNGYVRDAFGHMAYSFRWALTGPFRVMFRAFASRRFVPAS